VLLVSASGQAPEKDRSNGRTDREAKPRDEAVDEALGMSRAVACLAITGYEQYEPLPVAEMTSEEKLLVYYRPRNYQIDREGSTYHAHLTQDGEIHRRGEKPALQRKAHMVDYDVKEKTSPDFLFIRNTVSLKGLKPGEYDYVIILHDELNPKLTARQAMPFRIVPVKLPRPEGEAEKEKP
jgi:hypothetical protein